MAASLALLSLPVVVAVTCSDGERPRPRCTSLSTQGRFNGQTFVPNDDCYMAVLSRTDTRLVLRGKWVMVHGGSNAMITFAALANSIESGVTLDLDITVVDGACEYLDIVWRVDNHGQITRLHRRYEHVVRGSNHRKDGAPPYVLTNRINAHGVPAHSGDLLRLTFTRTDWYPAAEKHLEGVKVAAHGWPRASQLLYHQIGQWYVWGGLEWRLQSEAVAYMGHAQSYCRRNACYFADLAEGSSYQSNSLRRWTQEAGSGFHFVGFGAIVHAKRSELTELHVSPFIALWMWWILLNSAPNAAAVLRQSSADDVGCTERASFGNGCVIYQGGQKILGSHHQNCHDCSCNAQMVSYDCASARYSAIGAPAYTLYFALSLPIACL